MIFCNLKTNKIEGNGESVSYTLYDEELKQYFPNRFLRRCIGKKNGKPLWEQLNIYEIKDNELHIKVHSKDNGRGWYNLVLFKNDLENILLKMQKESNRND